MKDKKSKIILSVINLIIFLLTVSGMFFFLNKLEWYLQVLSYTATGVFTVLFYLFMIKDKESLYKSFFSLNATVFIIVLCFVILNIAGIFESFKDGEKIKKIILDSGNYGIIIYLFIVIFQVVVLPAPSFIFYMAGTAIFGPLKTFLISYVGVIIGSEIAFIIGRYFGKNVVYWCIGKEKTEKYCKLLGSKGYVLFTLMQILPFFPDDILCMVAGLSDMKHAVFTAIVLVVRPIYIAVVCFFGTGDIIPFYGWGIAVWALIFVLLGVGFAFYCKYQKEIESWFSKKLSKNK